MAGESKSIRWTVTAAMIFVAYLAWGFMAGSYAESSHVGGVVVGSRGLISAVTMLLHRHSNGEDEISTDSRFVLKQFNSNIATGMRDEEKLDQTKS